MIRILSIVVALCATASKASACAACFGKTDAPLAEGMNAGIFVMLGFVVLAWIAFGSFFVFIARRSRATTTDGDLASTVDSQPSNASSPSDLQ